MPKTETTVTQLKINRLTKTQFDSAQDLSNTELYAVDQEFIGGKLLKTDSNGNIVESTVTEADTLPDQTNQSGKYLTTNGTTASWGTVDALPSQTSQSGKYLTTDGTSASWANIPTEIPSQSGQNGKFLTTNGSNASWGIATKVTIRRFS